MVKTTQLLKMKSSPYVQLCTDRNITKCFNGAFIMTSSDLILQFSHAINRLTPLPLIPTKHVRLLGMGSPKRKTSGQLYFRSDNTTPLWVDLGEYWHGIVTIAALTRGWGSFTVGNVFTSLEKHDCSKPTPLNLRRVTSTQNRRHHRVPGDFCTETSAQTKLGSWLRPLPTKWTLVFGKF